jgi:hypothetical protein
MGTVRSQPTGNGPWRGVARRSDPIDLDAIALTRVKGRSVAHARGKKTALPSRYDRLTTNDRLRQSLEPPFLPAKAQPPAAASPPDAPSPTHAQFLQLFRIAL